ncbi:unnamed protein product [marine sediment metagenome]|uniref:DUF5652 domain-containing protein n=1 Tax=marine sediment metagenome TaxID=412755 RepID=X1H6V8_9ZZZZ
MGEIITIDMGTFLETLTSSFLSLLIVVIIILFVILLKGFAMYRAARKESKGWFWVLLIFETFGILPLLYLIFSKKQNN